MGLGVPISSDSLLTATSSSNRGMPPPPPPPPALMEELIEDVLLRFPPDEPASLFRSSLVCKPWCRLISGPRFRRRYREFHRTPPMLGFICNNHRKSSRFVRTTATSPLHAKSSHWVALDARHGRVLLLGTQEAGEEVLVVWDPITDERKELPIPPPHETVSWAAAILCSAAAAGTCNHLDCHRGPFTVVFVGSAPFTTFVCTYSSDVDAWSEIISSATGNYPERFYVDSERIALVGNALYFVDEKIEIILKYNLEPREMSWIDIPVECFKWQRYVLTAMEEDRLGLVTVIGSKLYVWLRNDGHEVGAGWVQTRVIELKTLLPFGSTLPRVAGFADGLGIVFLKFNKLLYTIDLKTNEVKKPCQSRTQRRGICVVPYMSFYTPALEVACSGEEPSAGGSSA